MDITVLDLFEKQVKRRENKTVFKDSENSVTYSELGNLAKKIATDLVNRIKGKNQPVVVFIDRNIESLITFLGITYSGNFYAPIDVTQPEERIRKIITKLNPALVINATNVKDEDINVGKYELINYKKLIQGDIDEEALRKIRTSMIDSDPLYVMFTSGSTGTPKGVLIKHSAVIDLVKQFKHEFKFNDKTIFGNQAPFDFDVSVKDLYSTYLNGASLVIIPRQCFMFPSKLISFVNLNKINTGIWSTSVLRIVENMKGLKKNKFKSLKQVMFSGEVMPIKVLNYWRENQPEIKFVNLYGPTEITCNCTFFKVNRKFNLDEQLPIGRPFKNVEILLLDEKDKLITTKDFQGEICVRASTLALGYYNDEEISKKAFVQNPLNDAWEEKIYRTGDLGKYNEHGELLFIGRMDHQIKHMGHRIELAEIEHLTNGLDFINASVCVHDNEADKIYMFYEADTEDDERLYNSLKELVPKYMLPNKMFFYEKLPVTKNGKIDRVLLKGKHCGNLKNSKKI